MGYVFQQFNCKQTYYSYIITDFYFLLPGVKVGSDIRVKQVTVELEKIKLFYTSIFWKYSNFDGPPCIPIRNYNYNSAGNLIRYLFLNYKEKTKPFK